MKRTRRFEGSRIFSGAFLAVAALVLMVGAFSLTTIVSHAQEGKVTGKSVNVRAEASSSSEILASVVQGNTVDIIGSVTGSDGYTWYQIYIDATRKGYVRSDFVQTSGSVGALSTTETTTTNTDTTSTGATVSTEGVTPVSPVSASVTGGQSVRVRADASTSSSIVTTVEKGLALTVTGTKAGSDGNTWYLVDFIKNNASVNGYIRSDFVTLSGDLTEAVPAPAPGETAEPAEQAEPEPEPVVEQKKRYETQLQGEDWYLLDYEAGEQYGIQKLFDTISTNQDMFNAEHKKAKGLRVALIIFILIAILSVGGAAFFYLKWRDITDKIAFEEAEKNRRNRQAQRTGRPGPGSNGQRPQGQRPAPNGQRPAPNGQRPAQGGQRPAPNGQKPQGQRPAPNGQRPQGGQRPVQTAEQQARQGQQQAQDLEQEVQRETRNAVRDNEAARARTAENAQNQKWKSRNFTDDDDEFEFGFLNWDEDDKN